MVRATDDVEKVRLFHRPGTAPAGWSPAPAGRHSHHPLHHQHSPGAGSLWILPVALVLFMIFGSGQPAAVC
jgi:hypothetical protein